MTVATDDFNRANTSVGLGSTNWAINSAPGGNFKILSSTAATEDATFASDALAYYTATTFSNDQYAKVIYFSTSPNGVGVGIGPAIRCGQVSTDTVFRLVGNQSGYEVSRAITGSYTNLSSASTTVFNAGDAAYIQLQGTVWIAQKNGTTFVNNTDASAPASGPTGMAYSSSDLGTFADSWEGGDLAASGVSQPIMMYGDLSGIGSSGRFFKDPLQ